MQDKFLPIGTIVILKNGTKKIMITSYLVITGSKEKEEKKMFDYGGYPYPVGMLDSSYALGFNHDQIDKVIHMGHVDNDHKELSDLMNKNYKDFHKLVEK